MKRTRRLPLQALYNCRDLGGFPTAGGGVTRYGVFLRSEAPCDLPQADIDALRAYGVTETIDLRGGGECRTRPSDLSGLADVTYHHKSLFNEAAVFDKDQIDPAERKGHGGPGGPGGPPGGPGGLDWGEQYKSMAEEARDWAKEVLQIAAERLLQTRGAEVDAFAAGQPWLGDYALYTAIKAEQGMRAWSEWPAPLRLRDAAALDAARKRNARALRATAAIQFLFFRQWEALRAHAKEKGVRLLMHNETASAVEDYERQLPAALEYMNRYGYDAVKTGYCGDIRPRGEHHYGQYMNRHYLNVVRQAAEHHIMVNAHEASRPTGLIRTYPNYIAQESARGGEYEAFPAKKGNPVEHTLILPFTRLQGGPMDYTPGVLETSLAWAGNPCQIHTTVAGQLALYLTMPSPLQMAADLPEHYEKYADAFVFIRDVALDWDDSRYLEAEPGEYITVARKAAGSEKWFVGGKTAAARTTAVPLDFLGRGKTYRCTIWQDAPDAHWESAPEKYIVSTQTVDSHTTLTLYEADGGGFAIEIIPE